MYMHAILSLPLQPLHLSVRTYVGMINSRQMFCAYAAAASGVSVRAGAAQPAALW